MSRLPYPDRQDFPKVLRDFLDQLPHHAAFDMLSHSQATVEGFSGRARRSSPGWLSPHKTVS
ncbi:MULTISPECIES: hypothetical protein [unclassified Streptomyces]|uniref:hypothetical protein n=1 Tax=unclassified Streptomyces TaxID=2593676 RepID=UPI003D8CBD35